MYQHFILYFVLIFFLSFIFHIYFSLPSHSTPSSFCCYRCIFFRYAFKFRLFSFGHTGIVVVHASIHLYMFLLLLQYFFAPTTTACHCCTFYMLSACDPPCLHFHFCCCCFFVFFCHIHTQLLPFGSGAVCSSLSLFRLVHIKYHIGHISARQLCLPLKRRSGEASGMSVCVCSICVCVCVHMLLLGLRHRHLSVLR